MCHLVVAAALLVALTTPSAAGELSPGDRQRLVAHLEMTEAWLASELHGLSQAQLTFKMTPESWSIMDVVEHLYPHELSAAFDELHRTIRPGGVLVMHTSPNKIFEEKVYPHWSRRVNQAALGLSRSVTLALPHFQGVALAVASGMHIAAVPVQFADAVKDGLGLRTFLPPIDVPVPDVNLYWHSRYDNDLAHKWMRTQIIDSVRALGFVLD